MIPYKYYLVSLAPDPIRNEVVNIGLVGFLDGQVYVRMLNSFEKVKAIAPGFVPPHRLGDSIRDMLSKLPSTSQEDFLLNMSGESLRISEPARGLAQSVSNFQVAINQLFDQLVKPLPKGRPAASIGRLKTEVKQQLIHTKLFGDDIAEHKVVTNFQVGPAGRLVADFAYRNGKLNIIETVDLRASDLRQKFKDATMAAIVVDTARKKIDASAKGRAVYMPHQNDLNETAAHLSVMQDYFDQVYNFADREERKQFYIDIEADLRPTLLNS